MNSKKEILDILDLEDYLIDDFKEMDFTSRYTNMKCSCQIFHDTSLIYQFRILYGLSFKIIFERLDEIDIFNIDYIHVFLKRFRQSKWFFSINFI